MKTCYDLYEEHNIEIECCQSCHEDWEDYDIAMFEIEFKGHDFHVCCKGREAISRSKQCTK